MLRPKGYFKAFHQDTPLLFQFIYTEYLSTQRELLSLINLIQRAKKKASIEVVSAALIRLTGAANDYMRLFNWNHNDGILTKLKNNCIHFVQNSPIPGIDISLLHVYTDQAWLLTAKCLHGVQQGAIEGKLLQQSYDTLLLLGEILRQMIAHFKEDENVIFFLLRHKEPLDSLYQEPFVRNCFEKIYPEGLRSVSQFLIARYTERGFVHLIPIIEKLCRT